MILVYSTFPNKKEAEKMGERLVKSRLAACCNIFPIGAVYSWKGKISKDREFAAIIKTRNGNFKKVERFILKNHSYDTPCILEIPVVKATKSYLAWLIKNTSK